MKPVRNGKSVYYSGIGMYFSVISSGREQDITVRKITNIYYETFWYIYS